MYHCFCRSASRSNFWTSLFGRKVSKWSYHEKRKKDFRLSAQVYCSFGSAPTLTSYPSLADRGVESLSTNSRSTSCRPAMLEASDCSSIASTSTANYPMGKTLFWLLTRRGSLRSNPGAGPPLSLRDGSSISIADSWTLPTIS